MAEKEVKENYIVFTEGSDEVEITVWNRKWINRMRKLVAQGHATEVEARMDGTKAFVFDISLLHMPFYRKPREYTEEQLEASRKRLAAVREAVAGGKSKPAAKKVAESSKAVAKKSPKAPVVEEDIDDEDFDEEDEDLVVIPKKLGRTPKRNR